MEATQAEPGLRLIREREEPLMKTVIVGANHGGIAAANTLLDHYPDHRVVMIDQNTNISYLGCGTALWVGRQIDSYQDLFYTKKPANKSQVLFSRFLKLFVNLFLCTIRRPALYPAYTKS